MGSTTVAEISSLNRCCPNAVRSRSERVGFYWNEQGGVAFLVDQQGDTAPLQVLGTPSGVEPIERGRCRQSINNHMQQYDA